MPDLWFTSDHFQGMVSAMRQLTRLTPPSIPLGSVNELYNPCNYMDYWSGDHYTAVYGWLVVGQFVSSGLAKK